MREFRHPIDVGPVTYLRVHEDEVLSQLDLAARADRLFAAALSTGGVNAVAFLAGLDVNRVERALDTRAALIAVGFRGALC